MQAAQNAHVKAKSFTALKKKTKQKHKTKQKQKQKPNKQTKQNKQTNKNKNKKTTTTTMKRNWFRIWCFHTKYFSLVFE